MCECVFCAKCVRARLHVFMRMCVHTSLRLCAFTVVVVIIIAVADDDFIVIQTRRYDTGMFRQAITIFYFSAFLCLYTTLYFGIRGKFNFYFYASLSIFYN